MCDSATYKIEDVSYEVSKNTFYENVSNIIQNIKYKSNMVFKLNRKKNNVEFKMYTKCIVTNRRGSFTFDFSLTECRYYSIEDLTEYVLNSVLKGIAMIELHEMIEHFKFKGNHFIDPHPLGPEPHWDIKEILYA
jgi:hypothetical protein